MIRHWSLPNLLSTCDVCLRELIADIEKGAPEEALVKAKKMLKTITRLKTHCNQCDERIIEEI
jgi:hypothetical protein